MRFLLWLDGMVEPMKTPTKVTMFLHDADGKKTPLAIFRLRDGEVDAVWKGPKGDEQREHFEDYGIRSKSKGRDVFMHEGEEFMRALRDAFDHTTYVTTQVNSED